MKYDHLNLPQILRQIQDDLADRNLVDVELLRPTLEKIAGNSKFLHLARSRAQEIMQAIPENK
jgi:RNA-binding protein YhbY